MPPHGGCGHLWPPAATCHLRQARPAYCRIVPEADWSPSPDDADRPVTAWNRLAAWLRGEIPADGLEAFRRSGAAVYPLHLEVGRRVAERAAVGGGPWSAPPGLGSAALCVANALVLQTMGETLLEEDYAATPATRGHLPPVTAEQAWACFEEVGRWLSWARQGLAAAEWDVRTATDVPARLAVWVEADDYPAQHVLALCRSTHRVGEQVEAALGAMAGSAVPRTGPGQVWDHARVAAEGCRGRVDQLSRLCRPPVPDDLLAWAVVESRALLDDQFRLGQLLAAPQLTEPEASGRQRPAPARLRGPGEPGFDPWCLTSPRHRSRLRSGRAVRLAIDRLWRCDPEPDRTLGIQRQIEAALEAGSIRYAHGPDGLPRVFYTCPWGPIYEAVRPVRIGGTRMNTLTQFAFEVSAEQFRESGTFVRRLVRGPFVPAGRILGRAQVVRPAP